MLVEDVRGSVLGRAGAPDALPEAALRNATLADDEWAVQRVVSDNTANYLVWKVRLEGEVVARLWLSGDSELAPIDQRAVEHALIVLSLELVRRRTALEVELRIRGELLSDILGGAAVESLPVLDRLRHLGHDLSGRSVMIIAGRVTAAEPAMRAVVEQRALTGAAELAALHRPRPLIGMYQGLLVALWPADPGRPAPIDRHRRPVVRPSAAPSGRRWPLFRARTRPPWQSSESPMATLITPAPIGPPGVRWRSACGPAASTPRSPWTISGSPGFCYNLTTLRSCWRLPTGPWPRSGDMIAIGEPRSFRPCAVTSTTDRTDQPPARRCTCTRTPSLNVCSGSKRWSDLTSPTQIPSSG